MKLDLDAFVERSAIMEFDGGMSRFQAETKAAQRQGYQRREVMDAIRERDFEQARHQREAVERNGADHLPRVQPRPQEQA